MTIHHEHCHDGNDGDDYHDDDDDFDEKVGRRSEEFDNLQQEQHHKAWQTFKNTLKSPLKNL